MLLHSVYLPKYFEFSIIGFIYGVPPEFDYVYVLDVVSTNRWVGCPKIVEPVSPNMRSNFSSIFYFFSHRDTFETGLLQLHINVTVPKINDNITKTSAAIYNVKLKIGKKFCL